MKIRIDSIKENALTLMRRAGYVFQHKEGNEMSFVRVFARSGYPRFHVYSHIEGSALVINLHLDQKRETYGEGTRHHGEYDDSKPVQDEAVRLQAVLK
jgi:hypothetical protein